MISRRLETHRAQFLAMTLAGLLAGCSPTGGITVADEQEAGATMSRQVEEQVGIYTGEYLSTYVDTIGRRLVAHLGGTPYYFKFRVVDQPEPNAFAAPGGYIYLSRGLLALVNSEDELAGILAHEISHVTLRHHARQSTASVLPGVLEIPGRAVGAIVGQDVGNIINAPVAAAGEAYLSSYGRGQENEADQAAVQLVATAGYDPAALSRVLSNIERTSLLLTGHKRKFSFFDSHPSTPDRIEKIRRAGDALQWNATVPVARSRPSFYNRLDGLTWGRNNPLQGVFQGQQFMQPDMNLSIRFPDGWRTINTPRYVGAFAPDDRAIILFGGPDRPGDPRTLATEFIKELATAAGVETWSPAEIRIGEWPAFAVKLDDASGAEPISIYYLWVDAQTTIFTIVALGPQRYFEPMRQTGDSLRRLTAEELKSIVVQRVRIAAAEPGETVGAFSARTGNLLNAELTAAINGQPSDAVLQVGQLLKIVVEEPYLGQ